MIPPSTSAVDEALELAVLELADVLGLDIKREPFATIAAAAEYRQALRARAVREEERAAADRREDARRLAVDLQAREAELAERQRQHARAGGRR